MLVFTEAAAGVLIAAELAPLFKVRAGGLNVRTVRAANHHGDALALLAVVALGLAWAGIRLELLALAMSGS